MVFRQLISYHQKYISLQSILFRLQQLISRLQLGQNAIEHIFWAS
jgi:hypothetical protein